MASDRVVRTTCPYCGVGCGLVASIGDGMQVSLRGDREHPANLGRLCSKGAALDQTLGLEGRLLHPLVDGQRSGWDRALDRVAGGFARVVAEHGPDAVAFYVSGQLLTEDYYVANKLMKGFIGSANIDTNSRLCMSSSVAGHKRAFGSDTVPCSYTDLEAADLVVLVGSNTAWCHPVLFQRLRKAKKDNPDLRIVVVDPRQTDTCDIADLHLAVAPGADSVLFNGLLAYLAEQGHLDTAYIAGHTNGFDAALACAREAAPDIVGVARQCELAEHEVRTLYQWFAATPRVVTVYSQGVNQWSFGTDKVNAIINCHLATGRIGAPGQGPFSFTGQPNAMGGREVGGLANQLAAHLDLVPEHIALVREFWDAPNMAQAPGLKAVELFDAIHAGRIKAVWIMATNPAVSLPEADRVRAALAQCDLVVVSDCVAHNDTLAYADVVLPAATWGEKDGTVTNSERRISRQRAFLPLPGEARPDWWIVSEVAKRMGFGSAFDYDDPHRIWCEHAALSGHRNGGTRDFDIGGLAQLDAAAYADLQPVQWPVAEATAAGVGSPLAGGRFYHPDGRARFVPVGSPDGYPLPDDSYPLALNTGRVRDQWHTMTRTGQVPRLATHRPEPFVQLHPDDADAQGIASNDLVELNSRHGRMLARAEISVAQKAGSVFAPMHWNDGFAASGRVGPLVGALSDPVSGQPQFKHTPVAVRPLRMAWHGFLLTRDAPADLDFPYWVRIAAAGHLRYEIAGDRPRGGWPLRARALLAGNDTSQWIEFQDTAAGRYRAACVRDGRLVACLFIQPTGDSSDSEWLATLFEHRELDAADRRALLAGRPARPVRPAGKTICACFSVGMRTITEAIATQGMTSVEQIGAALQAGTNCGSCIPELEHLLQETTAPDTADSLAS